MKQLYTMMALFIILVLPKHLIASETMDDNRTGNIDDAKWTSLKKSIQESKLLPQPAGVGGNGISVGRSVSIDGNRALVGASNMDTTGVVYVLEFDGSIWIKTATIKPNIVDTQLAFGLSVSLSGDRALIGADGSPDRAYIYDYDGTNWVGTHELIAKDREDYGWFGYGRSVSLFDNRAVIGAEWDSISTTLSRTGSAFVFDYDGTTWTQTQKLIANDAERNDHFANVVGVSSDTVFIGASSVDGDFNRSGAVYVFDYDGVSWIQNHKLTGSSDASSSSFGKSLSLSGNKALISTGKEFSYIFEFDGDNWNETKKFSAQNGDYNYSRINSVSLDDNQLVISGVTSSTESEASVFDFDGSNWNKTQQIVSSDIVEKYGFGSSIALKNNNIIIGARNAIDVHGNNSGAAFVYTKNGASWVESMRYSITEDGSASAFFGYSVSLSGNRALVGAYGENDLGSFSGSAYIYDFDGVNWSETQKIHASDGSEYDYFGYSVSLLNDRALIGAYRDEAGSAYVFDFDGSQWTETQKLTANDGVDFDYFGKSVSLTENRVLIGANGNDNQGRGAAYIFDLSGSVWSETQKLTVFDSDSLGNALNIMGDMAIIADYRDDEAGSNAGAVFLFGYNGTIWTQTQKLLASDAGSRDEFGSSVHMSGTTIVVGASHDDDMGNSSGSAYVFDNDGNNWNEAQKLTASDGGVNYRFGTSVQTLGNTILVGSRRDSSLSLASGSAYVFKNTESVWIQSQKVVPTDYNQFQSFGQSVSLGVNKVLIGAYGDNDHGNASGSAYIINIDLIFKNSFDGTNIQ